MSDTGDVEMPDSVQARDDQDGMAPTLELQVVSEYTEVQQVVQTSSTANAPPPEPLTNEELDDLMADTEQADFEETKKTENLSNSTEIQPRELSQPEPTQPKKEGTESKIPETPDPKGLASELESSVSASEQEVSQTTAVVDIRSESEAEEISPQKEEPHLKRTLRRTENFHIPEEFTIIYPALAHLAVRADDPPGYYICRSHDDVIKNALGFSITWLDFNPKGQLDLYDIAGDDNVTVGSVICRVRMVRDPDHPLLLRLPKDQQEKIKNILAAEKENSDYEYHSSDERFDEKRYVKRYLNGEKATITTTAPVESPISSPKKATGKRSRRQSNSDNIEFQELEFPPRKKRSGRPKLSEEEKAKRALTRGRPRKAVEPLSTPTTRRSRRGRQRKQEIEEADDFVFDPTSMEDEDIIEEKPKRRSRSPKKTQTTKRTPRSPKRAASPRKRSPARSPRSPRRKKNEPDEGVEFVEFDPTYGVDSDSINETCCLACTAKVEPLRACLTDNINLLKEIVQDKKRIASLVAPRSVAISVTPVTVAMRRALITVPEAEEEINKAMLALEKKLQDASIAREEKKKKKKAGVTNTDGSNVTEPSTDGVSIENTENKDKEETSESVDEEMPEVLSVEVAPPSLSLNMIENRSIEKEPELSPLEKILAGEHNQFTSLRMLCVTGDDNNQPRVKIPQPQISKMGTGHRSRYSHHRSSNIGVSRGGKEGNNAFTHDESTYYNRYYWGDDIQTHFVAALGDTLALPQISFPSLRTLYYLFEEYQYSIKSGFKDVLRAGNRRVAARLINELDYEDSGFNFLHHEVLAYEHNQELSPIRTPASITKLGFNNITPLHCACIQSSSKYLEQFLKAKPDAINVTDMDGYGLIHYAVASETPEALKFLMKSNINIRDTVASQTPLMIAARYGRVHNINAMLVDQDPVYTKVLLEQTGEGKNTALHWAAKYNQVDSIRVLLAYAKKAAAAIIEQAIKDAGEALKRKPTTPLTNFIDKPNYVRQTALSVASMHGNMGAVKVLLESGAKIDKPDKHKRTPLIHAVMNGSLKITSYLIRMGADPSLPDSSQNTPIHYAAAYGWKEIAKFLISPKGTPDAPLPGASVSADVFNDWKLTPLGIAFAKGHIGVADELLADSGVDVNITDDEGLSIVSQTCAQEICSSSMKQLEYLVVQKNANVNIVDLSGCTALHHLIDQSPVPPKLNTKTNSLGVVVREPDAKQQEKYEETNGMLCDMIRILVSKGIDINRKDKKGITALQLAIQHKNLNGIALLIESNADPSYTNPLTGENVLHALSRIVGDYSLTDIFQAIQTRLGQSSYDLLLQSEDHWGFTPFLFFFRLKLAKVTDIHVATVLQETLTFLLNSTELPLLTQTVGRLKQWREFTEDSLRQRSAKLLSQKITNHFASKEKETLAKFNDDEAEINEEIARKTSDPDWTQEPPDVSFLYDPYFYEKVSKHAVEDRSVSKKQKTEENQTQDDEILPQQEKEISLHHPGFGVWGKCCVLHMVSSQGSLVIPFLFSHHSEILRGVLNQQNVHGYTPLHHVLEKGLFDIATSLLELGADVTVPCGGKKHFFPIHYATEHKQKVLLRKIISLGSPVDAEDNNKQTALMLSCAGRWRKGLLILLESGANINHRDIEQRSALHFSIQSAEEGLSASFDIEEILLNSNIDVNLKDIYQRTALHYAFCKPLQKAQLVKPRPVVPSRAFDPIEIVSSLCEVESLLIDEVDCFGNSPLAYASQSASTISSLFLIRREADVNRVNKENNSPLGLALQAGWSDFAIVLMQKGANVSHPLYETKRENSIMYNNGNVFVFTKISQTSQSMFKHSVQRNWQGVAYTMLDSGFENQQAVLDALSAKKFSYLETLMRKTRSVAKFSVTNDHGQNFFHTLGKVCTSSDGAWSLQIAKQFRRKRVDPAQLDKSGRSALHYAAEAFNYELCLYLLARGDETIENADSDNEDYMDTSESANYDSGCALDPNQLDSKGFSPFALIFFKLSNNSLYGSAAQANLYKLIALFVKYGAKADILFPNSLKSVNNLKKYISPLHQLLRLCNETYSSSNNAKSFFAYLCGSELRSVFSVDQVDGSGRSLLHRAIHMNSMELVKLLIDLKASVTTVDNQGRTLAHYVVKPLDYGTYENTEMLDVLTKAGSPLNDKDSLGFTPMHYAASQQTSTKLLDHFKSLGVIMTRMPLSRTPTAIPKPDEFPERPDIEHDSQQTLKQAKTTTEEKQIQLDTFVAKSSRELFVDDTGVMYHVILTKVDVKQGKCGINNFYKLQLAHDTLKDLYILFTKWGRIGATGEYQRTPFNNQDDAIAEFVKVFKQKTGNVWSELSSFEKKPGKYHLMQENRRVVQLTDVLLPVDFLLQEKRTQGQKIPECSLPVSVVQLMEKFCDIKRMKSILKNTMHLQTPLGFLKREDLQKALHVLQEIQVLIDDLEEKREVAYKDYTKMDVDGIRSTVEAIAKKSNSFYEFVPQDCENAEGIVPIDNKRLLKQMYDNLDSLMEIAAASKFLLAAQYRCRVDGIHPYDYVYSCLSTLIKPIDKTSPEYSMLLRYCPNASSIQEIYCVHRLGEPERISKWSDTPNHQLLWHGSSLSNFLGILSGGLKIAPPEAPSTGMMFGRGIYHSDAYAKAIKYSEQRGGVLMLNEVVVGKPYCVREAQYMESPPFGFQSTKGEGRNQPIGSRSITMPNGLVVHHHQLQALKDSPTNPSDRYHVQHNEYVVYDTSQVRIRYIVQLK